MRQNKKNKAKVGAQLSAQRTGAFSPMKNNRLCVQYRDVRLWAKRGRLSGIRNK